MAQPEPTPRYTPAQYLALERAAETKSEYLNGEIFAMAGASRRHNLITGGMTLRRNRIGRRRSPGSWDPRSCVRLRDADQRGGLPKAGRAPPPRVSGFFTFESSFSHRGTESTEKKRKEKTLWLCVSVANPPLLRLFRGSLVTEARGRFPTALHQTGRMRNRGRGSLP